MDFLTVYIKEAHTTDGWQMGSNVDDAVCYPQPRTMEQRLRIANDFVERFEYSIPLLVDGIDNAADEAYAAWPERLYIVDETGAIAYRGHPGPFRFHPGEVERWLQRRFPEPKLAVAPPGAGWPAGVAAPSASGPR